MVTAGAAVPKSEHVWRENLGGAIRATLEEILDVGRRNGVDVDGDLYAWGMDEHGLLPAGHWAGYGPNLELGDHSVPWARYETRPGSGRVKVLLSKRLGAKDDEILAVLIHETTEIQALDEEFARNGRRLMARRIDSLLNPRDGTLHCGAWTAADDVIFGMIDQGVRPR